MVNNTLNFGVQRPTIFQNNVPSPSGGAYGVQLFPGLNNILVPRGAFLSSPLGQALLNDSSVNPAALPGPLTFNPSQWETWVNSSETPPGSANYVQVVSSTDMSCGSGPASACQGLASNPALEPGAAQSRQVQSTITFNVSSQTRLNDLLGGLVLNLSGNLTGSLLNATGELPTLGLSSNVLMALANPAYTNVGAWGAPTSSYTPPPPRPSWWAEVAAVIMNSVSGVLHTVEGLVSVLRNAAVAAEAYLAKVAQAEANALGITALANQLGSTLRAVAAAMLGALAHLINAFRVLVEEFLSPITGPIVAEEHNYDWSIVRSIDPSGPEAVWEAIGGSLFLAGVTLAVLVQVALGIATGIGTLLSGGLWVVVQQVLIGLIVTAAFTVMLYALPSLVSPGPAMVNVCETVADGILPAPGQAANWTTWAGAFAFWENGYSSTLAFRELRQAWTNPDATWIAQGVSFVFSLAGTTLALGASYFDHTLGPGQGQVSNEGGIVFTVLSIVLEGVILPRSENKPLDGLILGMDAAALTLNIADWQLGY